MACLRRSIRFRYGPVSYTHLDVYKRQEGKYETDEDSLIIYADGHNMKYTAASPAGCESEGNTEYWYCETCGKYFSDILGVNEIEENSWVTEAAGHTFDKDT